MLFANIFIGCYLLFAVFWDSPQINLIHKAVRARIGALVRFLGLTHAWNMYSGPFRNITRLETRLRHSGGQIEILPPPKRYEFRRYYFMIGVQDSPSLYKRYLDLAVRQARLRSSEIEQLEIVRRIWKSPSRIGGLRGRFKAQDRKCHEIVVARWTRQ